MRKKKYKKNKAVSSRTTQKRTKRVKKIPTTAKGWRSLYRLLCLCMIPIQAKSKKPLAPWKKYQDIQPTVAELREMFGDSDCNVGIVTGKISGIIVVDLDTPDAIQFAKDNGFFYGTPRVKTSKGYHLYFEYKDGIHNSQNHLPGIDIRGDGGFVVAPPSVHESGHVYCWVKDHSPMNMPFAEYPEILTAQSDDEDWSVDQLLNGVAEGERNNSLTRLTGHWLAKGLDLDKCFEAAEEWNQKNRPPLPEKEVEVTVKSIFDKDQESGGKQCKLSLIDQVIELLTGSEIIFFTDELGEAYVRIFTGTYFETLPLSSKRFRLFISETSYKQLSKILKESAVKEVLTVLKGKASFDGPTIPLAYRVARQGVEIWIDLGDNTGSAIRISANGWTIVPSKDVPILFRRYTHMKPLPVPAQKGDINALRELIPVKNEDIWILLRVWLVTAFIPDIPRPALVIHGLQGAGKSIAGMLLRLLIDPSEMPLLPISRNSDDFTMQLNRNYALVFDNLRYLKPERSDTICRAITGAAASKRQLYTNDDEIIYRFIRLIILNGISNPVNAPDLLDRSILIELSRIKKEDRMTEQELMAKFEEIRPEVLGAICDALSETLGMMDEYDGVIEELPRMADWAQHGYVAAEELGIGGDEFLEAYERNTKLQHFEVVNNDPVASTVKELAEKEKSITGTPSFIYQKCKALIDEDEARSKSWPKDAAHFSRRLKLACNNLRELGIVVEWDRGIERQISIKLIK